MLKKFRNTTKKNYICSGFESVRKFAPLSTLVQEKIIKLYKL